ncbi:MAG: glycosyltransferase family 2 protein [Candidatus Scalinduaceae bacterium]
MKYSIIIPTYNSKRLTIPLIEQVLSERIQAVEILVIDDCSDDDTYTILRQKFARKIQILRNKNRLYVAYSRNRGINESVGDTLVFIDGDVIFTSGMLRGFLEQVSAGFNFPKLQWENGEHMPLNTSSVFAVQREVLKNLNGNLFDENIGIYGDDTEFFIKAKKLKIPFFVDGGHIFENQKAPNSSSIKNSTDFQYFMSYKNRIYIELKFINIIEGYTASTFLMLVLKNFGRVLQNIVLNDFRRASLILKGLVWNIMNVQRCLDERSKLHALITAKNRKKST